MAVPFSSRQLTDRPKSATYVTLHLDRKAVAVRDDAAKKLQSPIPSLEAPIQVDDQGAWSSKGRRKAQEDAFVLHEVHDTKQRTVLLAGVMDGHLGTAASHFVRDNLPEPFTLKSCERAWRRPTDCLNALGTTFVMTIEQSVV